MLPNNSIRSAFLTSNLPPCFCWAKFKSFLSTSSLCVFLFFICLLDVESTIFLSFVCKTTTNNQQLILFCVLFHPNSRFLLHPSFVHPYSFSLLLSSIYDRKKKTKTISKDPLDYSPKNREKKTWQHINPKNSKTWFVHSYGGFLWRSHVGTASLIQQNFSLSTISPPLSSFLFFHYSNVPFSYSCEFYCFHLIIFLFLFFWYHITKDSWLIAYSQVCPRPLPCLYLHRRMLRVNALRPVTALSVFCC